MNLKLIYALALIIGITITGCKKSDNFRERNLDGKWDIKKCNVDGIGRLISNEYFTQVVFEFDKDGDFTTTWKKDDEGLTNTPLRRGTWKINGDGELDMTFFDNSYINIYCDNPFGVREVYEILDFSKDAFEIETVINGKTVTIHAEGVEI